MDVSKAFGKAIKMRRVQLDLTQEVLANDSGMARSFISGVERGEIQPSTLSVYKLAKTLNTQPSELWRHAEHLMEE